MAESKKRKDIEDLVCTIMKILDPKGYNEKKYKEFFLGLSDAQFKKWITEFLADEDSNFTLETTPFVKEEVDLDITNIKKAADFLKVPLDEYIYLPFVNEGGKPVRSREKTPVGYIHIKRLEQILSKKNAYSSDIVQRNSKTGQVTSADKNGRVSDMENYALLTLGADAALREFLGPRADDQIMKQDMLKDISRDGYTSLKNMDDKIENKTALNTLDVYYTSSGLITDLITPGYHLKRTLNDKEAKEKMDEKYK